MEYVKQWERTMSLPENIKIGTKIKNLQEELKAV
jgi:hypothetical protein